MSRDDALKISSKYNVGCLLGQGSYGSVFRAETKTGENVALKSIKWKLSKFDQGIPTTVVREAGILKSLQHHNIIELIDIEVREDCAANFIMTLCDRNLREHVEVVRRSGSASVESSQLQRIMSQTLSAVNYCHERNILHRDLKPDNILLDYEARNIKIADFGMSRLCSSRAEQKLTDRCVTLWYRAPEIMMGDQSYGPAVDMWSVGCIMMELINLYPVFACHAEIECLLLIFKSLGTPTPDSWPNLAELPFFQPTFPKWPTAPASELVNKGAASQLAMDLICAIVQISPSKRVTAADALNHEYFRKAVNQHQETVILPSEEAIEVKAGKRNISEVVEQCDCHARRRQRSL